VSALQGGELSGMRKPSDQEKQPPGERYLNIILYENSNNKYRAEP
jgi:hypothetical protein